MPAVARMMQLIMCASAVAVTMHPVTSGRDGARTIRPAMSASRVAPMMSAPINAVVVALTMPPVTLAVVAVPMIPPPLPAMTKVAGGRDEAVAADVAVVVMTSASEPG